MRLLCLVPALYLFTILLYLVIVMSSVRPNNVEEPDSVNKNGSDGAQNSSSSRSRRRADMVDVEDLIEANWQDVHAKRFRVEQEFKAAYEQEFYLAHLPKDKSHGGPRTALDWAKSTCERLVLKFIAYTMDMQVKKMVEELQRLEDNLPVLFFARTMVEEETLPDDPQNVRNTVLKMRRANKSSLIQMQYELIKLLRVEHAFIKLVVKDQVFHSIFWAEVVARVARVRDNPLRKDEVESMRVNHMTILKELAEKICHIVMGQDLPPEKRSENLARLMESVKECRDQLPLR